MDGHHFDELTRALSSGTSRRMVIKGLLGGAVGGLAAVLGGRRGAVAHHKPDHTSGHCAKEGQPEQPQRACCLGAVVDAAGRCRCPEGATFDDATNACVRTCDGICGFYLGQDCRAGCVCSGAEFGVCMKAPEPGTCGAACSLFGAIEENCPASCPCSDIFLGTCEALAPGTCGGACDPILGFNCPDGCVCANGRCEAAAA